MTRAGTIGLRVPLEVRFWAKVDRRGPDDCWLWTGARTPEGYGNIGAGGRGAATLKAHRVSYEIARGPIPAGLDLDHLCRVPACVNPDHLEPVTRQVNLLRGKTIPAAHATKDLCVHGHAFTTNNTYRWRGVRYCRQCRSDRYARAVRGTA